MGWLVTFTILLIWPISLARWWPETHRHGEAFERLRSDGAPATALPIALENAFDHLPTMAYTPLPQSA